MEQPSSPMTGDELRRRFRALPDDPQQVEMAWRTLQIITQPKPEPVWPDHDRARPRRAEPLTAIEPVQTPEQSPTDNQPPTPVKRPP